MGEMWKNSRSESRGLCPGRQTIGPLLLMTLTPPFTMLIWYSLTHTDGSLTSFYHLFADRNWNLYSVFLEVYPSWHDIFSQWKLIFSFAALELFFMKVLPGKRYEGPVSPAGHIPVYKENGVPAFICSIAAYFLFSSLGYYKPGTAYHNLGAIYAFLTPFSLLFCLMLYFKGKYFPSGPDHGSTGNFVIDFYWGTELYPRILGWDIKTFTNCRFGLMAWVLLLIDYAVKQYYENELCDALVVSVALQLIYLFKFYWWESGYWSSLDIMHDRAGYYICWGCLVWVPSVYTSGAMYLAAHPLKLGFLRSLLFFSLGVLMIWINYDSDRQRQHFRAKKGKEKIWGREPEYIVANYTTEKGENKTSLLLCSGYWGISRHFHYIPEILAALFWGIPYSTVIMPYFYVIFLTILLVDRSVRDDYRCASKYGPHWNDYRKKVPYRIIPYLF